MECVFGLVGNDFAIVVADTSAVHSILVHKSNEDKIMFLDSHKLIAASGEPGDRFHSLFILFVTKSIQILILILSLSGFNLLNTFKRTLLCINSVMGSLSPLLLLLISLVASSPPLSARYSITSAPYFCFSF
jgi:hypothetical protein